MTHPGKDSPRLRSGSYDARVDAEPAPESQVRSVATPPRRRFVWGEHPFAEVALCVLGCLAAASWLAAAALVLMLVESRDAPEGMTGLAFAFGMPPVLAAGFGLTGMTAAVWHRYWGARGSLVVGVVAALAAIVAPCAWMALVHWNW